MNLDTLDEYTLSEEDLATKVALKDSDYKSNGVLKPFRSDKPSPYQASEEYRSKIEQDFPAEQSALHNPREPHTPILHEKFVHHAICYIAATGATNIEIAKQTGLTPVTISNVLRQPWAREKIAELISKNGQPQVEQLLKGAAVKAVERLIVENDNCNKSTGGVAATRISAANAILDRVFGKATQPIIQATLDLNKLSDEELAKMLPQQTTTH